MGGTFDPVHLGHVVSALDCAQALDLRRVLLVLSARPPHKPDAEQAPIERRWAMLQSVAATSSKLEACDVEIRRPGVSYTVDTLAQITRENPRHELFLILGIDAYDEIDTWHQPERLLELANLVVTTRPGHTLKGGLIKPPFAAAESCCYDRAIGGYVHESGHRLIEHPIQGLDISATEIRRRVRTGQSVSELTGPVVSSYIQTNELYGAHLH